GQARAAMGRARPGRRAGRPPEMNAAWNLPTQEGCTAACDCGHNGPRSRARPRLARVRPPPSPRPRMSFLSLLLRLSLIVALCLNGYASAAMIASGGHAMGPHAAIAAGD